MNSNLRPTSFSHGGVAAKITEHFYTMREAANRLGVERHTVWQWIKKGNLESQNAGGVVFIEKEVIEGIPE